MDTIINPDLFLDLVTQAIKRILYDLMIDGIKLKIENSTKTGRTNANDGGIDFVTKPLGRFFQVTETLDF